MRALADMQWCVFMLILHRHVKLLHNKPYHACFPSNMVFNIYRHAQINTQITSKCCFRKLVQDRIDLPNIRLRPIISDRPATHPIHRIRDSRLAIQIHNHH